MLAPRHVGAADPIAAGAVVLRAGEGEAREGGAGRVGFCPVLSTATAPLPRSVPSRREPPCRDRGPPGQGGQAGAPA